MYWIKLDNDRVFSAQTILGALSQVYQTTGEQLENVPTEEELAGGEIIMRDGVWYIKQLDGENLNNNFINETPDLRLAPQPY